MNDLIVPVYLNQKIVFDLLAMLQGGISTVKAVTQSSTQGQSAKENVSTTFGLSDAFSSLLSIKLGGGKESKSHEEGEESSSEEKIQTPASLLYQLRILLRQQELILPNDTAARRSYVSGDFVEISGLLKKSPALECMEMVHGILDLMHSMQNIKDPKKKFLDEKNQMSIFLESLKSGNSIDMICTSDDGRKVVVTLDKDFLRDPLMMDLIDGQFKIFGKIISVIDDKSSSINLLRRSSFGCLPEETIKMLFGKLIDPLRNNGYSIPELQVSIPGPIIQIIPIAIYA